MTPKSFVLVGLVAAVLIVSAFLAGGYLYSPSSNDSAAQENATQQASTSAPRSPERDRTVSEAPDYASMMPATELHTSFVGTTSSSVMFVSWSDTSSGVSAEMEAIRVNDEGQLESLFASNIETQLSGSRVVTVPIFTGFQSGVWTGEIKEPLGEEAVGSNAESPNSYSLLLTDPSGETMRMIEGTEQDYSDAVVELSEQNSL